MPGVIILNPVLLGSGSVTGLQVGGQDVSAQNPVPVSGTVNVTGIIFSASVTTVDQGSSGSQAWKTEVENFPAVQAVTGTVGLSGPVTGAVKLTELAAVQTVSGSYTELLLGGQPISLANPLPITGSNDLFVEIKGGVEVHLSGTDIVHAIQSTSSLPWIVSGSDWVPVVAQGPVASGSQPWNFTGSVGLSGPITGTVGIAGPITGTVGLSGPITGAVKLTEVAQVTGTVGLSGPITGTVVLGAPITGTVGLSGPVTGNVGLTGPITGAVKITESVQVVQASGTTPWSITGSVGLTGPVTGTVGLSGPITGTVVLGAPITGTVGLSGPVTGNVGLTGPITGAVKLTEAVQVMQASGTTPWSITGSVGLTGPITGTVALSAPITGTVVIGSAITGTFGLSGPVTGNVGLTGPITGAVKITETVQVTFASAATTKFFRKFLITGSAGTDEIAAAGSGSRYAVTASLDKDIRIERFAILMTANSTPVGAGKLANGTGLTNGLIVEIVTSGSLIELGRIKINEDFLILGADHQLDQTGASDSIGAGISLNAVLYHGTGDTIRIRVGDALPAITYLRAVVQGVEI